MATAILCTECKTPMIGELDPRKILCSDRCRKRRSLRLQAEARARRVEEIRRLFADQERAALSGDVAALDALRRRAARVLGDLT